MAGDAHRWPATSGSACHLLGRLPRLRAKTRRHRAARGAPIGHRRDQQGEHKGARAEGSSARRRGRAHPAGGSAPERGQPGATRDHGHPRRGARARRGARRAAPRLRGARSGERRRARHLCRAHRLRPREDDGGHGRAHAAPAPLLCRGDGGGRRRGRHGGRSGKPDATRDRGRPAHHRPGARHRHAVELLPDARAWRHRWRPQAYIFADCAINAEPNAQELADIAITSAESAKSLLVCEPRVALLSFSTHGSASHPRVDKVRAALEIARRLRPDLAIDGELQGDAAVSAVVAAKKVPGGSPVAGRANVLVFPDLDCRQHRLQAGAAPGQRHRHRPLPAGLRQADLRPVAGRQRRRHRCHGGGGAGALAALKRAGRRLEAESGAAFVVSWAPQPAR